MSRGHVRYDKGRKVWYVDLHYLGERHRVFKYMGVMDTENNLPHILYNRGLRGGITTWIQHQNT